MLAISSGCRVSRTLTPCVRSSPVVVRPGKCVNNNRRRIQRVLVQAQTEANDFDAFLNKLADKFEKTENKPIVVAYIAGAASAILFAEWLIHKPLLDVLLGFPIQLLGLLVLPSLSVRYLVEEKDLTKDVEDEVAKVSKLLPGLDKK